MKYKIIEAETSPDLEKDVEAHLSLGWELLGGVQAMRINVGADGSKTRWVWIQSLTHNKSLVCKCQICGKSDRTLVDIGEDILVCGVCLEEECERRISADSKRLDWLEQTHTGIGFNVEAKAWGVDVDAPFKPTIREAIDAAILLGGTTSASGTCTSP